jgi:hypothetical protein
MMFSLTLLVFLLLACSVLSANRSLVQEVGNDRKCRNPFYVVVMEPANDKVCSNIEGKCLRSDEFTHKEQCSGDQISKIPKAVSKGKWLQYITYSREQCKGKGREYIYFKADTCISNGDVHTMYKCSRGKASVVACNKGCGRCKKQSEDLRLGRCVKDMGFTVNCVKNGKISN